MFRGSDAIRPLAHWHTTADQFHTECAAMFVPDDIGGSEKPDYEPPRRSHAMPYRVRDYRCAVPGASTQHMKAVPLEEIVAVTRQACIPAKQPQSEYPAHTTGLPSPPPHELLTIHHSANRSFSCS